MKFSILIMTAISSIVLSGQEPTTPNSTETVFETKTEKTEEVTVDGKTMPVQLFLQYMRYPRVQNSWMKMSGKLTNKSKMGYFKVPIEVRGLFDMESWRMQLIISNWERWYIRQKFTDGEFGTSKIQEKKPVAGERSLAEYGIRPEDITLSFLYWDFVEEDAPESISRLHCRVLRLRNRKTGEEAKVWVSSKYIFTMKVQWFSTDKKECDRELLFKGTNAYKAKSNPEIKIHVVDEVKITGKDWKTSIKFEAPEGDIVDDDHPVPVDLFVEDTE